MKWYYRIPAIILCIAFLPFISTSFQKSSVGMLHSGPDRVQLSAMSDNQLAKSGTNSEQIMQLKAGKASFEPGTVQEAVMMVEELKEQPFYSNLKTADKLYYIEGDKLNSAERNLILSLQGIVAQEESQIFVYYSSDKLWFEALQKYYGITMEEVKTIWDMVDLFKDKLQDNGFVRYTQYDSSKTYLDNPTAPCSINTATVISGMEKYLIVEDSLVETAISRGLEQKADALDYFELDVYFEYQDKLNKDIMTSLTYNSTTLRDVSIALKTMVWRDSDIDDLTFMLSNMNPNGILLGWHDAEYTGVLAGTTQSYATIASDTGRNFSVFAGLPKSKLKQKPPMKYELKDKKDVHYVTFIMSDGDNIQWVEGSYTNGEKYFAARSRGEIPYGWTLSPSLVELSPLFPRYLYSNATVNDNFVAAFSGLGYMYPSKYPASQLEKFTERTAKYMDALNMSYTTILDLEDDYPDKTKRDRVLNAYSKHSNIKGGFLYYHIDRYVSSQMGGGIFWSNGKPFVSMRESLWVSESNQDQYDKAEVASQMAHRINSYKKDCTVIDGYTAVNVHPWSFSYDYCTSITKLLDDNVVVVTPSEFMELIAKNVEKKDVPVIKTGKKNMHDTFDYTNMKRYYESGILDLNAIKHKQPTDMLIFDFNSGGTQGWIPAPGNRALDQVHLLSGGIEFIGSYFGQKPTEPNGSIYNKIILPEKADLKLNVTVQSTTTMGRIQVVNENSKVDTIYDWTDWANTYNSTVYTADLSEYAGKTVTVIIQFRDESGSGAHMRINKIVIE